MEHFSQVNGKSLSDSNGFKLCIFWLMIELARLCWIRYSNTPCHTVSKIQWHFFVPYVRFYANEKKNWLYYICSIEYCRWHIVHLFSTLNRIEWRKGASRANNTQKVIQLCITVIKRRLKKRQTFTSNNFEYHKIAERTIDAVDFASFFST